MTYKPSKLDQNELVFLVCDQSLSVGLHLHYYKYLHIAVMTCATLVNTQKHGQTAFDQLHY